MRIALLTQAVPLPDRPAVGLYNIAQAQALNAIGIETLLLSVAPRVPRGAAFLGGAVRRQALRDPACQFEGVPICTARARTAFTRTVRERIAPRFPRMVAAQFSAAAAQPLLEILSDFAPSAILAHGMLPWGTVGLKVARNLDVPIGFIEHSQEDVLRITEGTRLHRYACSVARGAQCVFTVSQRMVDHMRSLAIGTPRLLLNGVHAYDLPAAQRESDQPFTVLCAGSYIERKGHAYLIQAFANAQLSNAVLKLVGDPPKRIQDAINRAGIRSQTEILPLMSNRKLLAEMAKADLFALPSWNEAFGLVFLEALSVGTPVLLTSDAGAAAHLKQHTHGWIVPPQDTSAISIALRDAYVTDMTKRLEMGRAGKELVSGTFSWRQNATQIAESLAINPVQAHITNAMQEKALLPVPVRIEDLIRKEVHL